MSEKGGALRRAYEARTRAMTPGATPAALPRRQATFVVTADTCAPGIFDADIEITMRSLSSREELEAIRESRAAETLTLALAKRSIYAVDGAPVSEEEREFLWEALGTAGRVLVGGFFAQIGAPGELASGKALETLRIH